MDETLSRYLRREIEEKKEILSRKEDEWIERIKNLDALRDLVARFIDESHEKQEKYYNKGRKEVLFSVEDKVMRRVQVLSTASKNFCAKLAPKYEGPFEILEIKSPTVYILNEGNDFNMKGSKINVSRLKRYIPPRGNCDE